MRIGLVELLLILLIAALSIGPSAALWVGIVPPGEVGSPTG